MRDLARNFPSYFDRQVNPGNSRTDTFPRLFTVTRPAFFDADTPPLDRFSRVPRPARTLFRKMNPMTLILSSRSP